MSDNHTFEATREMARRSGAEDAARSRRSRATPCSAAPATRRFVGSSPPVFGGDAARYNPEELMAMSLSHCHMLTYLALAAKKQVAVLAYEDRATGVLGKDALGKMQMDHGAAAAEGDGGEGHEPRRRARHAREGARSTASWPTRSTSPSRTRPRSSRA